MKLLKKINRGAITSLLVLVAVIIYLVALNISHNNAQPKIKEICEKYVQIETTYKMLPKKFRTEKPTISKAELAKYIETMENDLNAFYPKTMQNDNMMLYGMKNMLNAQAEGNSLIYDFQKTIKKYKSFEFDGDAVTVTFTTSNIYKAQNYNNPTAKAQKISTETDDNLMLQKIDGQWKIVYPNLTTPTPEGKY